MGDIVITPASNDVNSTAGTLVVRTSDLQPISIRTNDINRLYIDPTGNVGIGLTNPLERLHVTGYILNRSRLAYTQESNVVKNGLSFYVDFNNKTCFDSIISASSIKDISNNNYSLTLVNAATVSNKDGNAALYTANNSSYLQIASYVMALPHTWEAWVNGDAFGTGGSGWDTIWDSGGLGMERPLIGIINGVLNVYPNTTNCGTLTAGKWYHIIVTADASSNIVTYINGVQTASFAYGTTFNVGTGAIWLGGDNSAETFNGYIPIARTYNRVLSSIEVMQNYNAEKWRFDNSSTFYHNVADGKVGIGTVSPASILNTVGAGDQVIRFAHSDNVAGRTVTLRLTNNNSTYADAGVYIQAIEGAGIDSYAMAFGTTTAAATTSTTKMLLDNAGKLGIGTTNPIASLEVDNTAANLPVLNLGGGEAGNAVSDLYVLNSYNNNTGVGYAAKVIGVNISSSLTSQNIPLQRTTWGGVTSATAIVLGTDGPRAGTQDNAFQIWTTNDGVAGTSLTQKFSLTSAGDVGIGTVAPAQKLDVNGAVILGINNSYGAYTRTPGEVLKPWFATASANTFFYNTNVSGSIFWQNAADTASLMSLTEQARLGINTTTPSGRLHVLDTVLYPPSLTWNAAAATIIRSENGQIAFGSDDTTPYGIWQQVRTSSSTARPLLLNPLGGNVGIGLRNPTKKLHVVGSLYWDYNGTSAEEHLVAIQRVVAPANGSYTEIGTLAASANSIRATFEIFHHDSGTIEYSLFELIANYYTGTTTDWVQLPSRTQAHYAGFPNGVVVDARLTATGGSVELRLRSIGGAGGNMTVNVRIKSNTNLTETSGTGTGATVAGLLGFNRYEFPVTDNRFKATYDGLFIKNNGFVGIGSTDPQSKLSISGTSSAIALSFGNTVPNNPLILSTYSGWAGIGMDSATAGIRLVGDYSSTTAPLADIGYYAAGSVAHGNWISRLKTFNNGRLSVGGMAAANTLSLLSVGGAGSTSAASGLTFGEDAQANLYRVGEDAIKTDGSLYVVGGLYNNNSAYYSSVSKTASANWGQYSTVLGNASYSAHLLHVSINGGNVVWAGTFLAQCHLSYRPDELWTNVKLLEYSTYNCSVDDVTLLVMSTTGTNGYGTPSLVLKTNGSVNGGYGTGYANNITVTVNGPSPSAVNLSNSWTAPYAFQIATSANTKQIYVNEAGRVGIGTAYPVQKFQIDGVVGNPASVGTTQSGIFRISNTTDNATLDFGIRAGGNGAWLQSTDETSLAANYALLLNPNGGNVGIGLSSPAAKLDVAGTIRLSSNLLSHKTASYTTSYPGISSFGADATDANITYYDTGKTLPTTNFRGVVWTGKHYIFTDYNNLRAYFYDNNFTQITNAYGFYFVTLPLPSGSYVSPHGAAWDGRYLWVVVYTGSNTKIIGYDLDTTTQTATIIAESAALPYGSTYDVEYADGHLYTIASGTLFIYKWNGATIDLISSYAGAAGTISAQAITYDGSYLWATQNGVFIYKIGLDGTPLLTISSGFPPNTCGWAWNGSNIVSFDFTNRNIFIINTTRLRIDTQNLALMGGKVGIGITNPGDRVQANLAAGESILANIISNAISASNKIGFKLSELGTAAAEFSLVRDGTSYQAKLQTLNNQPLSFGTNTTTRMVIGISGNVGIGSTNPTALLNIRTSDPAGSLGATPIGTTMLVDSSTSNYITFRNSVDNATYAGLLFLDNNIGGYIAYGNAGASAAPDSMIYGAYQDHIFQNGYVNENLYNRTETLRIKQNGRVGIGTNTPTTLLSVGGLGSTTAASGITLGGDATANLYRDTTARVRTDGAFIAGNYIFAGTYLQTSNGNIYPGGYGTSALVLNVGNTAASDWETYPFTMRRGAYVGIGTNLPSGKLHVASSIAGETLLRADGTNGTLFSVVDDLSDSLMSVNNSAGLPVLEVFADDRVVMGQYGSGDLVVRNNKVGIGTTNPINKLSVIGNASIGSTYNVAAPANGLIVQGNVGIGTTVPNCKLNIYGEVQIASSSAYTTHFNYNDVGTNFITTANGGTTYFRGSSNNITSMTVDGGGTVTTQYNTYLATVNGNVGIGTNNAAQKLDVRGYVVSDVNSNAVAGGYFLGNNSHGIRRDAGSNDVRLHTNGGDLIFGAAGSGSQQVTLKNGGNLGVAVINPIARLHVSGNIQLSGAAGGSLNINTNNLGNGDISFDGSTFAIVSNSNSAALTLSTSSTERVKITSAGNLGINQTNPTSKLHIVETTATGTRIQLGTASENALMNAGSTNDLLILNAPYGINSASVPNSGAKWGIKFVGATDSNLNNNSKASAIYAISEDSLNGYNRGTSLAFYTNQFNDITYAEKMRIFHNGNVGIGTSNPSSKLEVYSAAKTSTFVGLSISNFNNYDGTAASLVKSQLRFAILESPTDTYNAAQRTFATCDAGNEASNSSSDGFFAISTRLAGAVAEKFRITSAGNVGIGTTNPVYKLDVTGGDINFATNSILRFGTVGVLNLSSNANDIYANIRVIRNSSTTNQDGMYIGYDGNGTTAAHLRFYANGTSERMRIQANDGHVGIGTVTAAGRLDVYDDTNAGHISFVRNANAGSNAYTAMVFRRNGGNNGLVMFTNSSARTTDGGAGNSTIRTDNGKLLLGAGATTYHALETDGNVGIGLTNPVAARLHIKGDGSNPVLRVETALLQGAAGGTAGKTFVGWMPMQTGALSPADTVYIPLFK